MLVDSTGTKEIRTMNPIALLYYNGNQPGFCCYFLRDFILCMGDVAKIDGTFEQSI